MSFATHLNQHSLSWRGLACRLLVAALLLAAAGGAQAGLCHVTTGGTPSHDGNTWAASMDLQTALGDPSCGEIWVKAGVYKPGTSPDDTFTIAADTRLFGGFAGDETSRDQRNPRSNRTILSGDIDDNDSVNRSGVTETADAINGDNSHHVVTMNDTDPNDAPITAGTVLDGFTITAGDNTNNTDGGGGLWCKADGRWDAHCSPSLRHLAFLGNRAKYGGALAIEGTNDASSTPTLDELTFSGNSADEWGGAMYNNGDNGTSSPTLTNVTFSDNSAGHYGGAIYNNGGSGASSPTLTNVTFDGNHTGSNGGAMVNNGGEGDSSPTLTNVTFSGNSTTGEGGAIFSTCNAGSSEPTLTNVTLTGNSAHKGGAMYIDCSTGYNNNATFTNAILWGNSADTGEELSTEGNFNDTEINYSIVQGGCPAKVSGCWSIVTTDPLLGPLQNNGGFTPTMLPGLGSPAIDAGDGAKCPATDQRGVARSQGAGCDIGAVELAIAYAVVAGADSGSGQTAPLWHDFANPLVVRVLEADYTAAPGVAVHAEAVPPGPAGAQCSDARSDASGYASIHCRANGATGMYSVHVRAVGFPSVPPANFMLTNIDDGDTIFRDDFDPPGPPG